MYTTHGSPILKELGYNKIHLINISLMSQRALRDLAVPPGHHYEILLLLVRPGR